MINDKQFTLYTETGMACVSYKSVTSVRIDETVKYGFCLHFRGGSMESAFPLKCRIDNWDQDGIVYTNANNLYDAFKKYYEANAEDMPKCNPHGRVHGRIEL